MAIRKNQTIYQQAMNNGDYIDRLRELAGQQQQGGAYAQNGAPTGATGYPQGYAQMQADQQKAQVLSSGNTQAVNQYLIDQSKQMNPYQSYMAAVTPTSGAATQSAFTDTAIPSGYTPAATQKDYLIFGRSDPNFKVGMSDEDRSAWDAAGSKYAAGDTSWNRDTNIFRENGNWSGYYDDNGGYNGWLRAVNGVGGYAPAFGGKIGETGYEAGTVFYGPDGTAWTMGADGSLTKSGTVTTMPYGSSIGVKAGYQDSPFWVMENGQYKRYTNQTAPDSVLEAQGYYRDDNGLVMPQDREYFAKQLADAGQLTRQEYNYAMDVRNALKRGLISGVPQDMRKEETPKKNPSLRLEDGELTSRRTTSRDTTPSGTPTPSSTTPTTPTTPTTQSQPVQYTSQETNNQSVGNPYQAYLDQWDYDPAPEWEGTEYQAKRDAALEAAGEKWQGSEYQPLRDAALKRAEDMRWNYDVNADPVYHAYQKQYRREGDRAMQEALAQASMRTGGLANSYAVTAASQAGNYYASQLSDKIPQLYNDAYNRYLQEFQRQLGISDQYQGFDDREYSRWADQQGRNFDVADRYNQYGNTEYQRYLDRLGQYNTDRNFSYGRYRDAVGDYRYDDETQYNRAWNEEVRDYNRAYQAQRDAILDNRADREWAQELRAYADAQGWKQAEWQQYLREYGDQLSEKERQWAYQMARDAESDRRYNQEYADSRADTAYDRALREDELAYDRAWNEDEREYERGWDTTKWNQALREYDDEQAQQAWNNEYKLSGKIGSGSGSGYSGGGSNTTKTANGDLPKGQYRQGGYTYLSDKTHPQGQPMTAMYEQAYQDTWDKWQSGMDYALLLAEVKELVINKTVTDYEGEMILRDLRKWKEQGRQVDASKGGGGGGTRTQMTR